MKFGACILVFVFIVATSGWGQQAHYRKDGPALLNDLSVTPGDVATTDAHIVCQRGYASKVRKVSEKTKKQDYKLYGAEEKKGVCCEVDHLISLELGGSNSIENLWPQPYLPRPGAHEKDEIEGYLHRQVCSGKIPLQEAQKEIAADWYKVFIQSGIHPSSQHEAAKKRTHASVSFQ
ncbi:MAG: HNH endonuclease [Terriglobia bacterium]